MLESVLHPRARLTVVLLLYSPLPFFVLAVAVHPSSSPLGEPVSCPDLDVRFNGGCWHRMEHIRMAETYVLPFDVVLQNKTKSI